MSTKLPRFMPKLSSCYFLTGFVGARRGADSYTGADGQICQHEWLAGRRGQDIQITDCVSVSLLFFFLFLFFFGVFVICKTSGKKRLEKAKHFRSQIVSVCVFLSFHSVMCRVRVIAHLMTVSFLSSFLSCTSWMKLLMGSLV